MKLSNRVVITGIGGITPLGNNIYTTWKNILKGKSGIGYLPEFNIKKGPSISEFKSQIGGTIKNYEPKDYFNIKEIKKYDEFMQYGLIAAEDAWQDSKININESDSNKIGVSMSSGIGGLETIEYTRTVIDKKKHNKISPFCIPATIINMISGNFSIKHKLRGPNISIVTACATGAHNIGISARMIAYGDADIMVAGGAEKANTSVGIGGFAAARALSTNIKHPEKASRPWDKKRNGFVMSNGAGALILENYEHAKQRKAKIYGEIIGFGMNADAYHITSPSPNGEGSLLCMQMAIKDAKISEKDINYINAHATSTIIGDIQESKAVEKLLGKHSNNIIISSTKSMTGHMLGATGAIEAIFCLLAIQDQIAPPTINLDNIEEGCNLDYAPNKAKHANINIAMSNSFGFGGTNASLIFKKL